MKYLFWLIKLRFYIAKNCDIYSDWYSWTDWREMFDDGLTVAEAFAECHRDS